jgi:hypothetical protein
VSHPAESQPISPLRIPRLSCLSLEIFKSRLPLLSSLGRESVANSHAYGGHSLVTLPAHPRSRHAGNSRQRQRRYIRFRNIARRIAHFDRQWLNCEALQSSASSTQSRRRIRANRAIRGLGDDLSSKRSHLFAHRLSSAVSVCKAEPSSVLPPTSNGPKVLPNRANFRHSAAHPAQPWNPALVVDRQYDETHSTGNVT